MWIAIMIIAMPLAALIAYTIHGYRRHLAPSTGTKIDPATRSNTALLIVDVQEDFTRWNGKQAYPVDLVDKLIAAVNELVEAANRKGSPVISIRHTFRGWYINLLVKFLNNGRGGRTSTGLDLDTRIDGDIDHDIVKSRADAFHEPELDRILAQHDIGKLIIVGLDGDFCINATINGALNRGYDVSFSDATTLALNKESWRQTKSCLIASGAKDGIEQDNVSDANKQTKTEPA